MEYAKLVNEIKFKVDIVELISGYVGLQKTGSTYKGLCPFHAEKTSSFSVNPIQGFFYCFGCKKGGDSIKFLMEIEKVRYDQALEILCERIGIKYNKLKKNKENKKSVEEQELYSIICDLNLKLVNTFEYFLVRFIEVKEYILKKRLISSSVVKIFGIGFLPSKIKGHMSFYNFLLSKGYSKEILKKSGLFSKTFLEDVILSNRLIFPIRDFKGNLVGFGGRILAGGEGPKYINLGAPEIFRKRELLYGFYEGINDIKKTKSIIICEGYLDVLAFFSSGINNAVATLGTVFTREHLALVKRYVNEIILCFDGDEAGLLATLKSYEFCLSFDIEVNVISMEKDSDPAYILEKEGASKLRSIIDTKQEVFDYLLERYSSSCDLSKAVELNKILKLFFNLINLVDSDVRKEIFLEKLARKIGTNVNVLRKDLNKNWNKLVINNSRKYSYSYDIGTCDRYLLANLLKDFRYFNIIRRNLIDNDLEDINSRKLFMCFEELYEADKNFSLITLKETLKDKYKVSELFLESMLKVECEVNEGVVVDMLLVINKRRLKLLEKNLKTTCLEKNISEISTTLNEIKFLNVHMNNLRICKNEN